MNDDLTRILFKQACGYEMYDYQITLYNDEAKKLIINKPRQIGITTAFQFKFLIKALAGKRCLVVSKSYSEAANFIKELKVMYERLLERLKYNVLLSLRADMIEFNSGGWIRALANTTESGRSYSVDYILLDEYASYVNPVELYKAILPTITTKTRYQIIVNSTPKGVGNHYAYIWDNNSEMDFKRYLITIKDCPIFTDTKLEELRKSLDSLSYRQEYLNEFLGSRESYFPMDILNRAADKTIIVWEYPEQIEEKLLFGIDIGRTNDLTSIVGIDSKGNVKYLKNLDRKTFKEQKEFIKQLIPKASLMAVDQTGLGMQLAEELQTEGGEVVRRITITNEVKLNGFIELRRKIEQLELRLPENFEIKRSLNLIERRQAGNTITFDAPRTDETGHSDSAMALMLAVYILTKYNYSTEVRALTGLRPSSPTREGLIRAVERRRRR